MLTFGDEPRLLCALPDYLEPLFRVFCYLHVPFCASKCIYCDFYVELAKYGRLEAYSHAVMAEIEAAFVAFPDMHSSLETLYVGGGTPSLMPAEFYVRLKERLANTWGFTEDAEWTMEFNPNHVHSPLPLYREAGVNRVSVGVQTLVDSELKKLSRSHSAEMAISFIQALANAGFENISLDLMYGIPGQTKESWQRTLDAVLALPVQHISMYGLKVEEGTPLEKLLPYASYELPEDEATVEMYERGVSQLEAAGFALYEFSNLARPGFESRHNLNYWNNGAYLGLGPGAHGYCPPYRTENPRNLEGYLALGLQQQERTFCSPTESLENALIFGLRKLKGIYLPDLEQQYGFVFEAQFGDWLARYREAGLVVLEAGWLRLTRQAIPVSNTLLTEFIGMAVP